jgi:hypothetical protein
VVEINERRGYIDKSGSLIIQPQFDYAQDFNNGLALVKIKNKIGYIDSSGNFVWEPTK